MTLRSEIRAAERRLASATDRAHRARSAIDLETNRIRILRNRLEAHPTHVLTQDADPAMLWIRPGAFCRLCRVSAGSDAGREPCVGDNRKCHEDVAEGESPAAFEQHRRPGWRCGRSGSYDRTFTVWTCEAGHETTAEDPCGHQCLPDCPRLGLATVHA